MINLNIQWFSKKHIYYNNDLKEGIPSLIEAVKHCEKVIAFISVYNVEFEKMNNSFINQFRC